MFLFVTSSKWHYFIILCFDDKDVGNKFQNLYCLVPCGLKSVTVIWESLSLKVKCLGICNQALHPFTLFPAVSEIKKNCTVYFKFHFSYFFPSYFSHLFGMAMELLTYFKKSLSIDYKYTIWFANKLYNLLLMSHELKIRFLKLCYADSFSLH